MSWPLGRGAIPRSLNRKGSKHSRPWEAGIPTHTRYFPHSVVISESASREPAVVAFLADLPVGAYSRKMAPLKSPFLLDLTQLEVLSDNMVWQHMGCTGKMRLGGLSIERKIIFGFRDLRVATMFKLLAE